MHVDLHIHTHHSDGSNTPAEIVAMAKKAELSAIAITDHDAVAGIDEAIAAAYEASVEIIPGIEFSVEFRHYRDVHLLGYFINHLDRELQDRLLDLSNRRKKRISEMVERVNQKLRAENKETIWYDDVARLCEGSLGRPHLGRTLMAKGYAKDMEDAFQRYLIPCNIPKVYFDMNEALQEIKRVGGVAVLAHPTTITADRNDLLSIIKELAAMGLDGLEVFSNLCYKDDTSFLEGMTRRLGLVATGGSDFHGAETDNKIGSGRGNLRVPYESVSNMKAIAEARRVIT